MSAITVEEFVNKVSYKVDTESLKRVLRVTDKLYAHLGKALLGVSSRMDISWRNSMSNMAKASRRSARAIAEDGRRAGAAWRIRQPGTGAPTDKGGGTGGVGMGMLGLVGRLGGAYSVYSLGRYAVQSASGMEDLNTQFGVLLGSEEKAKALVASIQKLAASTPLTSMGVANVTKQLIAYGVSAENAVNTVRQLGDIAGGNQERLGGLAIAYGQVVSKGKLQGEEAMQFAERGFNITRVMADNLDKFGLKAGTTMADILTLQTKGLITPAMVAKAFAIATSEGGQFFQSMEKGSKTLSGLYSTFVDNFQMALIEAMQPALPLLKSFVDWIGQIDWGPVVLGVTLAVEGLKLFGRTLVEAGIFESLALIKTSIGELFGDGGATEWATIIRAAANMIADVFQLIAARLADISDWVQQIRENIIRWSPIILGLGYKMGVTMLSALGPIGAVIAALGTVYYAYQRINEAREQGARDEKYHAAVLEEAAASREHAVFVEERAKLIQQNRLYDEMGNPNDAGRAKRNATIAKFTEVIAEADRRRARANKKLGEASGELSAGNAAADPFSAILKQSLINTKKVTNNVTVNNNIATTVDDKGQTPLSIAAVKSVADTAVRSALNVKILGILEGV